MSGICNCGQRAKVIYPQVMDSPPLFLSGENSMWRYRATLPLGTDVDLVTMGEGGTPLVSSESLGPAAGLGELYFKLESCNPTGSFKDRIASLMVSQFQHEGVTGCIAVTTGNAGSAMAAYCARAGIKLVVGYLATAPPAKRMQMHAYGATVIEVSGIEEAPENLERLFDGCLELCQRRSWPMCWMAHRYNPLTVEAYKTVAYELIDDLGLVPDYIYVPCANAALFSAIYKGFLEYRDWGRIDRVPRMVPVQPANAAPLLAGYEQGAEDAVRVTARTCVSGAGNAYAPDGVLALRAVRESGGHCAVVTDEQTLDTEVQLGKQEGIFSEPAGALPVAAVLCDVQAGRIPAGSTAACVITGSGFKEPKVVDQMFDTRCHSVRYDHFKQAVESLELMS
tara:strand:+ start:2317 stop:3501 length:1185 start_codon:yes stop_codon:yes gene_type:complete